MFNTYNCEPKVTTNNKINACSGGIYKTYKESWFKMFHLRSEIGYAVLSNQSFFHEKSRAYTEEYIYQKKCGADKEYGKQVVVIQMIICGEMEVIAEIMYKEDYDKYFETPREEN